jgi:hypothetical protein
MTLDMLGTKAPANAYNDPKAMLRRDISEGDYCNLGDSLPQNKMMV